MPLPFFYNQPQFVTKNQLHAATHIILTMKTNNRILAPTLTSRDEFDAAASEVLLLQTEIDRLKAEEAGDIERIKGRYAEKLKPLVERTKARAALVKLYAVEHRAELLPTDAKSCEAGTARIGFRDGNPRTETLSKWTWEKATAAFRENNLTSYLKVSYEIARAKVLADGKEGFLENDQGEDVSLRVLGVKIEQDETFYIEPKPVASATGGADAQVPHAA